MIGIGRDVVAVMACGFGPTRKPNIAMSHVCSGFCQAASSSANRAACGGRSGSSAD
jgi:hypothetical protein